MNKNYNQWEDSKPYFLDAGTQFMSRNLQEKKSDSQDLRCNAKSSRSQIFQDYEERDNQVKILSPKNSFIIEKKEKQLFEQNDRYSSLTLQNKIDPDGEKKIKQRHQNKSNDFINQEKEISIENQKRRLSKQEQDGKEDIKFQEQPCQSKFPFLDINQHSSPFQRKTGFNAPPTQPIGASPTLFSEKQLNSKPLPIGAPRPRRQHYLNQQYSSSNHTPVLKPLQGEDEQNRSYLHNQLAAFNSPNLTSVKPSQRKSDSNLEFNSFFIKNPNSGLSNSNNDALFRISSKDQLPPPRSAIIRLGKIPQLEQGDNSDSQKLEAHKLQQDLCKISVETSKFVEQPKKEFLNVIPQVQFPISRKGLNLAPLKGNISNKLLEKAQASHSARIVESRESKGFEIISARKESASPFRGFFQDQKGNLKEFEMMYSVKTRAGQYSPHIKKTNQDSPIAIPSFQSDKSSSLFGVCDGHGEYGHLVSGFVKKNLPKTIIRQIKYHGGWQNTDINLQKVITKSFQTISNELLASNLDTFMSGTTAVTVLIHENALWCSNCGDSRAILGRMIGRGSKAEWKSIYLSEDHKPDLPREKKRIQEHGGRVEKSHESNQNSIFRVWNQTMEGPGLAMSRSLGDKAGREVGVISEPEIFEILLKEEDKFIIIASDGVWEFLSNSDVIKIVIPFYLQSDPAGAADAVVKASIAQWQKNDENVIDDITCVVLFFNALDSKKKPMEYI